MRHSDHSKLSNVLAERLAKTKFKLIYPVLYKVKSKNLFMLFDVKKKMTSVLIILPYNAEIGMISHSNDSWSFAQQVITVVRVMTIDTT